MLSVVLIIGLSIAGMTASGIAIIYRSMSEDGNMLMKRIAQRCTQQIRAGRNCINGSEWFQNLTGKLTHRTSAARCEKEISEALGIIRNLIMSKDAEFITADGIIEELLNYSGALRPAYLRMLSLLRVNERKEAAEEFGKMVESDRAVEFARLLIQIDEIRPSELYETLLAFQQGINDARVTAIKKQDEMISDLIYLPVIANLMLIFMNFIYTAYFIQQKDMLQMLF